MKKNNYNSSRSESALSILDFDAIGEEHLTSASENPTTDKLFELSDAEKKDRIADLFAEIMETLGMDLSDDSLKGTPQRVAKMYVEEIFSGLNSKNMPKMTLFDNPYKYQEMLIEKNIRFFSNCEHHFVPFFGHAHVSYISSGKVIGLSKLNRLVQHFAKRPQVQERLTNQIGQALMEILDTDSVAIAIEAKHLCVASRGVQDDSSSTLTFFYSGAFENMEQKKLFHQQIDH
jgi:GTP cyclohydrolase I